MRKLIWLFFLLSPLAGWGQMQQRVEIPAQIYTDDYHLIPTGSDGLLFFKPEDEKNHYLFQKYSVDLQPQWQQLLASRQQLPYRKHYLSKHYLYVLFAKPSGADLEILKLDIHSGLYQQFSFASLNNLEVWSMVAQQDDIYLEGQVLSLPILLHLRLGAPGTRALAVDYQHKSEFQGFYVDTIRNQVHVSLLRPHAFQSYRVDIYCYHRGEQKEHYFLEGEKGYQLLNGQLVHVNDQEVLIVGNYALDKSQRYTQGIYVARLDGNHQEKLRQYYDYSDLKNYFNYLSPDQQTEAQKRLQKVKNKEKDFPLYFRSHLQPIVYHQGQYILIDNSYEAELMSQQFSTTRPANIIFGGLRYSHATVVAFDQKGDCCGIITLN
ncbi:MAG: hypothetical protein HC880_17435, partial [Bacteroidia bacterium]|nr:hypothetical protein [Bacteroidia bacterium]